MPNYQLIKSSGHDSSINMEILSSIITKGFRQGFSFEHSLKITNTEDENIVEKELKATIPFATYGICEKVIYFNFIIPISFLIVINNYYIIASYIFRS